MKTTFALAILATVVSAHNFIFRNDCPDELALYNGGDIQALSNILPGGVDQQGTLGQTYWTNLNGGKPNGDNALKFLPGAEDTGSSSYYFIKPSNKRLGVGISVQPVTETCPKDGECKKITCDSSDCDAAFDKQEDASAASKAPAFPLYKCGGDDLTYLVTFCPGGKYATELESHEIHPKGDEKKCLDVEGGDAKDGAKLVVNDCNGSDTQKWNIDNGVTHVRVAGSSQCIENGENGVELKTCGSGWAPQRWDFNEVGRIGSNGICLDVENGVKAEDCKSQEKAQSQIFSI